MALNAACRAGANRLKNGVRRPSSPRGGRSVSGGFVLLEVLVGLCILSVGIVAGMSGLRMSIRTLSVSEETQEALRVLEEKLEYYARKVPSRPIEPQESKSNGEGRYQWKVHVESWDPNRVATESGGPVLNSVIKAGGDQVSDIAHELKQLRVTVSWKDGGAMRSVEGVRLILPPAGEVIWETMP